ncbi:tRNA (adenosine(37)-N6)-dimethylallyltransferase MiaA [Desulfobotulus mexicanus]|uniref:tRNA dimethylallyltransferase n=1 Tax=Desulfobotulus mexicanus TaxID=2586642 RepID=A0A5S5MCZ0_9BACT|nr:tRNA (adenosine(37)-N6)-dimethylallyltransferase MiaA [Desulfobotulus mexicanus]TYT73596.1 tRNA (adenosine(37)-N6)-dimethylallyltransferase MiaA [Desulfobotulus mexicanus]
MQKTRPGVIVICGPTASGKTDMAIELSRIFKASILSADSMQVYRNMNIGTAKPDPEELRRYPHAAIDIIDPDEAFDAAAFARLGRKEIQHNFEKGFLTIVAGGTGLYIKALLQGLFRGQPAEPESLARLEREAREAGSASLHGRLSLKDPEAAAKIHPNDTFRIVRALEFFEATGKAISDRQQEHDFSDRPDYAVVKIGILTDRQTLYERINARVDRMLEKGLEQEVKQLLSMGYGPELKSMQAIGYRHMADILQGRVSREEGIRLLKRDTRRYAKRQYTWFNADPEILWTAPESWEEMLPEIKKKLTSQGASFSSSLTS